MNFEILIIDDHRDDLAVTKMILSQEKNFNVSAMTDISEAIELIIQKPTHFSVVLLDYHMPAMTGLELAKKILNINPRICIAMLSADQSRETLKKCLQAGVKDFIEKDSDELVLINAVQRLCQKSRERKELFQYQSQQRNEMDVTKSVGLIGESSELNDVCKITLQAAKVQANVFISGESGTGKELVARAIHSNSPRSRKPFVAINVSAIPENLAESELFGHIRGAFTGADKTNEGKLISAQGGTLFLDEIGDLKLDLQVKLLRVLQEKKVTPIGGSTSRDLDVRIISATHIDLEQAMLDGRFREDLFYRLHVLPIHIPPLRERTQDIQPLIFHFFRKYGGEHIEVLMQTIKILERFTWRGNVRELENEVQRLISLDISCVEPKHLSAKILKTTGAEEYVSVPSYEEFMGQLQTMELEYLEGNIVKAGSLREASRAIFHAPPSTVHNRLKILTHKQNQTGIYRERTTEKANEQNI